jgi:hypothetical protein
VRHRQRVLEAFSAAVQFSIVAVRAVLPALVSVLKVVPEAPAGQVALPALPVVDPCIRRAVHLRELPRVHAQEWVHVPASAPVPVLASGPAWEQVVPVA